VIDFYCAKARLAVEIDGISHDMGDRPAPSLALPRVRGRVGRGDAWLEERGVTVVHIPAAELSHGVDDIADAIVRLATVS
jgi:very-short-patch-repair endonuclease